jgi:molybdate-binding protein
VDGDALRRRAHVAAVEIGGTREDAFTEAEAERKGDPKKVYGIKDLTRPDLHFINRQRQFKLDFVPIHTERYFLLCEERSLEAPVVREMPTIIQGDDFKGTVNWLPGYQAAESTGVVTDLRSTFPTPKGRKKR